MVPTIAPFYIWWEESGFLGNWKGLHHGLISYEETRSSKMSSSKKLTRKGTLRQVFIWIWSEQSVKLLLNMVFNSARHPRPLPATHCLYICTVLWHREGGGGRVEPERRLEGHQFTKLGRKYQHDWLYLQSVNSDKYLPLSPFRCQFFWITTFRFVVFGVPYSLLVHGLHRRYALTLC